MTRQLTPEESTELRSSFAPLASPDPRKARFLGLVWTLLDAGVSQSDVARAVGMRRQNLWKMLHRWERGE